MFPGLFLNGQIYIFFLLVLSFVIAEDVNITIPLNKTITVLDKELYGGFYTLSKNSTLQISLTEVNQKVIFIIFQVHTHIYNVTLYNNTLTQKSSITGTNVGLYGTVQPPDTYFVVNKNDVDIKMYISVHGYLVNDPIPGGCNMEFPIPISPFMHVQYTKDIISVEAPAAKDPKDLDCIITGSRVIFVFYRMYLNELGFDEDSYFAGLTNMMTLKKIREYGEPIDMTGPYQLQRRMFGAYPGTGSIYVGVAYILPNSYSIYVPTHTYACSSLDGCQFIDDVFSQFLCACLVFLGLFVCFLGHRFFKTEMFLVGMFAGIIITYILMSFWTDLDRPSLLAASLISGICSGAVWMLFWWLYGIPVLAVALTTMHLGFLLSSIVYLAGADGSMIFKSDGAFWTVFIILMLSISVTLTTVSYLSNLLSCAILGAYAVVFAIDQYMGSNLKYIVINTVRRAVVDKFNYVTVTPPFQWRDGVALLAWVTLAVTGFLFQHYHNRGRPPFPPPPRSVNSTLQRSVITYGALDSSRSQFRNMVNGVRSVPVAAGPVPARAQERTPLLADE